MRPSRLEVLHRELGGRRFLSPSARASPGCIETTQGQKCVSSPLAFSVSEYPAALWWWPWWKRSYFLDVCPEAFINPLVGRVSHSPRDLFGAMTYPTPASSESGPKVCQHAVWYSVSFIFSNRHLEARRYLSGSGYTGGLGATGVILYEVANESMNPSGYQSDSELVTLWTLRCAENLTVQPGADLSAGTRLFRGEGTVLPPARGPELLFYSGTFYPAQRQRRSGHP